MYPTYHNNQFNIQRCSPIRPSFPQTTIKQTNTKNPIKILLVPLRYILYYISQSINMYLIIGMQKQPH